MRTTQADGLGYDDEAPSGRTRQPKGLSLECGDGLPAVLCGRSVAKTQARPLYRDILGENQVPTKQFDEA
jgi:hypothetical protein